MFTCRRTLFGSLRENPAKLAQSCGRIAGSHQRVGVTVPSLAIFRIELDSLPVSVARLFVLMLPFVGDCQRFPNLRVRGQLLRGVRQLAGGLLVFSGFVVDAPQPEAIISIAGRERDGFLQRAGGRVGLLRQPLGDAQMKPCLRHFRIQLGGASEVRDALPPSGWWLPK